MNLSGRYSILLSMGKVLSVLFMSFVMFGCASFGREPTGDRLARIESSPHYRDGKFQNFTPREEAGAAKGFRIAGLWRFVTRDKSAILPQSDIPSIKTDLKEIPITEEIVVWLGHSSLFIQTDGKRILIDPVFVKAAPLYSLNKPFKGTELWTPEDMPNIDYLVITHDHWDHLDYDTVTRIKDRVGKVVVGLGVGEHFEYWGYDKERLIELDWGERGEADGFVFHAFTARHFSGRGLFSRDTTLWVSYLLETPTKKIFVSGDGGYDKHFAEIGKRFKEIDLAIFENGQYDEQWKNTHLMPQDLVTAVKDINAKKLMTVHNSKYTISNHIWNDPLIKITAANETESLNLLTPKIGEAVYLDGREQTFEKWWEN